MLLKNKIIIITGASRGLGRELAQKALALGAYVSVCSRDLKELSFFSQDTNSFSNHLPSLEYKKNVFSLQDSRGRGTIKITYLTVPGSLEEQVARRIIGVKYPTDSEILEKNPHECIEFIANKYYSDNKEKLFRESSTLLQDEMWVKNCEQFV